MLKSTLRQCYREGLYKYTLPDQHILVLVPSVPISYRQNQFIIKISFSVNFGWYGKTYLGLLIKCAALFALVFTYRVSSNLVLLMCSMLISCVFA